MTFYQLCPKNQIVEALTQEKSKSNEDIICASKLEWWTIDMLIISLLGVTEFLIMRTQNIVRGIYTVMHPYWLNCQMGIVIIIKQ